MEESIQLQCTQCNQMKNSITDFSDRQRTKKFKKCHACLNRTEKDAEIQHLYDAERSKKQLSTILDNYCFGCHTLYNSPTNFSANQYKTQFPKCKQCIQKAQKKKENMDRNFSAIRKTVREFQDERAEDKQHELYY